MRHMAFVLGFFLLLSGLEEGALAQSLTVAVPDASGSKVVAGRPYLMTLTHSDSSFSGSLNLQGGDGATPQLCTPSGGTCSAIDSSTCVSIDNQFATSFSSGSASYCMVMPDAGPFTLRMTEVGNPSMTGSVSLTSLPAYFKLQSAALTNRGDLPSCTASPFTYMGEPMHIEFALTPMSEQDVATPGYPGSWFTANGTNTSAWTETVIGGTMGLWMTATSYPAGGADTCQVIFSRLAPNDTTFSCTGSASVAPVAGNGTTRVTVASPSLPVWDAVNKVWNFAVDVSLNRSTREDGPYESFLVGIAPQDPDGVALKIFDMDADSNGTNDHAIVASTKTRYGRLKIANAYGSDVLPLPVGVQAQYWSGRAYANNGDDSCTPLDAANFEWARIHGANVSTGIAGTGKLNAGAGKIALTTPSAALSGKSMVSIGSKFSYLPGFGTGTFGVYKRGPIVYQRELHY